MTELHWEPGHKHGFEGLYAEGSDGYRYCVKLLEDEIFVSEISAHDDTETLTRYGLFDRNSKFGNLDWACNWAQRRENESKPSSVVICTLPPGMSPGPPSV